MNLRKNKIVRAVFLALLMPVLAFSQETNYASAVRCFTDAPDYVFPLFDKNQRLDMLDYYQAGMDRGTTNIYYGNSRITDIEKIVIANDSVDTSMRIAATEGGATLQLFVIGPEQAEPLIGTILTVPTPISDSQITLYNRRWQRAAFKMPTLKDWVRPEGKKRMREIEAEIPFIFASAEFDPQSQTLTITNNIDQYFVPSDTPEAVSLLYKQLTYKWNGKQFKLVK